MVSRNNLFNRSVFALVRAHTVDLLVQGTGTRKTTYKNEILYLPNWKSSLLALDTRIAGCHVCVCLCLVQELSEHDEPLQRHRISSQGQLTVSSLSPQ